MYFAEVPISPMVIFASLLQGTCLMCVHGSDADITVYSEIFCCELLQTIKAMTRCVWLLLIGCC